MHLSSIFIPSMRLILLLSSLLAVVPVSLICLALNPRIHINQFIHSLYPRPPPLHPPLFLTSDSPVAPTIFIRDAASKHIHFVSLSGSEPAIPDGCFSLDVLPVPFPLMGDSKLSVQTCLAVCNHNALQWGSVGDEKCRACFARLFNELPFLS